MDLYDILMQKVSWRRLPETTRTHAVISVNENSKIFMLLLPMITGVIVKKHFPISYLAAIKIFYYPNGACDNAIHNSTDFSTILVLGQTRIVNIRGQETVLRHGYYITTQEPHINIPAIVADKGSIIISLNFNYRSL